MWGTRNTRLRELLLHPEGRGKPVCPKPKVDHETCLLCRRQCPGGKGGREAHEEAVAEVQSRGLGAGGCGEEETLTGKI